MLTIKNITREDDKSSYVSVPMWRLFRNDGNFRHEGVYMNNLNFEDQFARYNRR